PSIRWPCTSPTSTSARSSRLCRKRCRSRTFCRMFPLATWTRSGHGLRSKCVHAESKKIPAIDDLPPEELQALYKQVDTERTRRVVENRLEGYRPYAKQAAFHSVGMNHRERLLMAGNQPGKSLRAGGAGGG